VDEKNRENISKKSKPEICTRFNLNVAELPVLHDVDRPEDLIGLKNDPRFSDVMTGKPLLSIIIPTLNEATVLNRTLNYLQHSENIEIIVVDGGSRDDTAAIATRLGTSLLKEPGGRAAQLNKGVENSKGRYLLFLHADTLPPHNYDSAFQRARRSENP